MAIGAQSLQKHDDAKARHWANTYPPLASIAVILFLALGVLPSALNLPQTNPNQTLEYAPVPPDDSTESPPVGNLASLGLGRGSTIGRNTVGGELPAIEEELEALVDPTRGQGRRAGSKDCVGSPPRQTADPAAPPCVGYFDGDNFGATYQGVTTEEVRVLIYLDGGTCDGITSQGTCEQRPEATYADLGEPPPPEGEVWVQRIFRGWQTYFNHRYQTYNRNVRFILYYSHYALAPTPEQRRGDAAQNFADVKPFAALPFVYGHADTYVEAMAQRGVLNFGSYSARPADFYRRFPKLIWGYQPSLELQARNFATAVCNQIVKPGVVRFAGGDLNGKPRKYGLLKSADPTAPQLTTFAEVVERLLKDCGLSFETTQYFPSSRYVTDARYSPRYATEGTAAFIEKGVTTIIWAQGFETHYTKQTARRQYYPEWIIAGDGLHEGAENGTWQDQQAFGHHAWVFTTRPLEKPNNESICFTEYKSANPDESATDVGLGCIYTWYTDLGRLFTAIQVAGPRLGPTSIDRGLHAIPAVPSKSNEVPACYYEPGDYTCVKDMTVQWWDELCKRPRASRNGCWRMQENGKRYLANQWPVRELSSAAKPDDVMNHYYGGIHTHPGPPEGT